MDIKLGLEADFEHLKAYSPRRFVPEDFSVQDVGQVREMYQRLLAQEIQSSDDLSHFGNVRSELAAAVDQQSSVLYIRMSCQTDDEARAQAYQHFIEMVAPVIKPLEQALNEKYLKALEDGFALDPLRYEVYTRAIQADVAVFEPENIPLQTELDMLSQEYQTLTGGMTVMFQGQEKTLPQMGVYLEEADRALREDAWCAMAQARLAPKEAFNTILDKMIALRHQVAMNNGCVDFIEYKFRSLHRFDYTPADCQQYHESVEKWVVPLWQKIQERRRVQMKLDVLCPWDVAVDPLGRAPLKPFVEVQDLVRGCHQIFDQVASTLGAQFRMMAEGGFLDLASRKGKAPGGYQSTLNETRKPFIFMNAVGLDSDVRTLLHEGGHAFHALACQEEPLLDYRHTPIEFCEVASMSMELLGGEHLDVFYDEEARQRSVIMHLEDIVHVLAWVAQVDAFQHWMYAHPTHTAGERNQTWIDLHRRFSGETVSWQGHEEVLAHSWHRQLHIYEVPLYYIEYGIAQLGALQLWLNSRQDYERVVTQYQQALALGGSRPLPELFEAAGIRFDFSAQTIEPLVAMLASKLEL